jgi:hypothetical protein
MLRFEAREQYAGQDLASAPHAQLSVEPLEVGMDRVLRHSQARGHLAVVVAEVEEALDHLRLAR